MDVVPETLFEEILTSVPSDEATIDQFLCYISYLLKVCEKVAISRGLQTPTLFNTEIAHFATLFKTGDASF